MIKIICEDCDESLRVNSDSYDEEVLEEVIIYCPFCGSLEIMVDNDG